MVPCVAMILSLDFTLRNMSGCYISGLLEVCQKCVMYSRQRLLSLKWSANIQTDTTPSFI